MEPANLAEFYNKFAHDISGELFQKAIFGLEGEVNRIKSNCNEINSRLDQVDQSYGENAARFREYFIKNVDYYEKAIGLRRDLIILNEKCSSLKKRAYNLKRQSEVQKTKSIIQKQKEIEEEKKLMPVFNPNTTLIDRRPSASTTHRASSPNPNTTSQDSDTVLVTSGTRLPRSTRKTRHRAHTIDPKSTEDQTS